MTILRRQLDWRTRLHEWAQEQTGRSFAWGETDCGSLSRAALIVMFGEGIEPRLPKWSSSRGALKILKSNSPGRLLVGLGAETTTLPFMRAGDIVVSAEPAEEVGHEAMMVCLDGVLCITSSEVDGVRQFLIDRQTPSCIAYSLWEVTGG